jgi:hypothetical protein
MEYLILFPAGIVIASVASLMGIAGGIVWVPFLILVMNMDAHQAILLSFGVQVVGMGSAVSNYIRHKKVYWNLAFSMAPFIFIGILIGSYLSQRIAGSRATEIAMGAVTMIIAVFFASQTEAYDERLNEDSKIKAPGWIRSSGVIMGSISGFLSIGIGDFFIPMIRSKLKIPMLNAVATSLILNFAVAVTAGLTHTILHGGISKDLWIPFFFAAPGVFIGGQLGYFLSKRVNENRLKEMFIFLLILIGLHMIYQAL